MPSLFISYRHESDIHCTRVRALAERLRNAGIDVILDFFEEDNNDGLAPFEGWPIWSVKQASHNLVLIIASNGWFRIFQKEETPAREGKGAAAEAECIVHRRLRERHKIIAVIVYFNSDTISPACLPPHFEGYTKWDANEDATINRIVRWVIGAAPTSTPDQAPQTRHVPVEPSTFNNWPKTAQPFEAKMANRDVEFGFFKKTLCHEPDRRATLIIAPSGYGKTMLLDEWHRYGLKIIGKDACCKINLKEIQTAEKLWETLQPKLDLPGYDPQEIERVIRMKLGEATKPLLIIFDTFNEASSDARYFVEHIFLPGLKYNKALRLLIAGKPNTLPDPAGTEWEEYVRVCNLDIIDDPHPWINYARSEYPNIEPDKVALIVKLFEGLPHNIAHNLRIASRYSPAYFKSFTSL